MTIDALTEAFNFTGRAIDGVGPDQWDNPTPCSEWNVRELVNHTIGAVLTFAAAAAGSEPPNGETRDFTQADPGAAFRRAAEAAGAAWPDAVGGMVTLGAEMPGSAAVGINLLDTLTHGWDIARATGQSATLPEASAAAALAASHQTVSEEARGTAGFAPAVDPGPDPSATDALVAFLGRQP